MTGEQHDITEHEHGEDPPNVWMYVGIVTVSMASFYLTLLITKLIYA